MKISKKHAITMGLFLTLLVVGSIVAYLFKDTAGNAQASNSTADLSLMGRLFPKCEIFTGWKRRVYKKRII